ncbi:hypothetical protein PBAL39_14279 [Pedobacter sp. BAL39]|uniref:hypothetical protein n=1 Tax=Pedobacter sp. BAL39 TaxID=391596 RepID=UPI000155AD60|nr:hypothetical protein [Pedobacter sp. BAL39]EDM34731.1 hypothetical protein PBAL39_14279 [Pedobacter sp. BAL39]
MIDMMQSDSSDKKKIEFEEKLDHISSKYERWFSNKTNKNTGEHPDKLKNYFRYFYNPEGEIQLYVKDDLPLEINKDCRDAFKSVFG